MLEKSKKESKKAKIEKRLNLLTDMLQFQIEYKEAAVPYNTKPVNMLNTKERDIRFGRVKRIAKLERRIRGCKKALKE